jgi:hypothetical protein
LGTFIGPRRSGAALMPPLLTPVMESRMSVFDNNPELANLLASAV